MLFLRWCDTTRTIDFPFDDLRLGLSLLERVQVVPICGVPLSTYKRTNCTPTNAPLSITLSYFLIAKNS